MRILFNRGSGTARALLPNLRGPQEAAIGFSLGGGQQHAAMAMAMAVAERSLVVIMGATGTGKSKLSIDVATRFPSEVVNADKIQLYRGLNITTNKIPVPDRRGVPHHLLGELDPAAGEMPPAGFRSLAASVIAGIASRRRLPVVAGGSNSLLHALLADRYDPSFDPFAGEAYLGSRQRWLRYRCCFLWVDVDEELLGEHLDQRVDEMVGLGMVEELEAYFAAEGEGAIERHPGLGKAIGVPEFRRYFLQQGMRTLAEYREAVGAIKENTRRLAEAQVRKIKRLGEMGWAMQRVDATGTVRARLNRTGTGTAAEREAWERDVMGPSLEAVRRFMEEEEGCHHPHQLLPLAAVSSSS